MSKLKKEKGKALVIKLEAVAAVELTTRSEDGKELERDKYEICVQLGTPPYPAKIVVVKGGEITEVVELKSITV